MFVTILQGTIADFRKPVLKPIILVTRFALERTHLDNWKTISGLCGSLAESQSTLEMVRREDNQHMAGPASCQEHPVTLVHKAKDPSKTSSSKGKPVQVVAASELPVSKMQQLACS